MSGIKKTMLAAIAAASILSAGIAQGDGPPVVKVGHVGHDHQIALGYGALKSRELKESCGAWFEELKPREVYVLHDGDDVLAELHYLKVQGGSAMPAAMERGELDIGFGGVAPVAFFVDKGNDFKILCGLNVDGDMLVMRPDFPADDWGAFVAEAKIAEKPLIIGYKAPVAVAKLIFERGLLAEGVPYGADRTNPQTDIKVRLVNLHGESNMIPSLVSGAVDGFVINEPVAGKAEVQEVGKVVCDLADLPPEGKWKNHPCCCIAARPETIRDYPKVLTALLKIMVVSTKALNDDPEAAAELAAEWTRQPLEVERKSVPHIRYLTAPDEEWRQGMTTWIEMMQEMGSFEKRFAEKPPEEVVEALCDFRFIREAMAAVEE